MDTLGDAQQATVLQLGLQRPSARKGRGLRWPPSGRVNPAAEALGSPSRISRSRQLRSGSVSPTRLDAVTGRGSRRRGSRSQLLALQNTSSRLQPRSSVESAAFTNPSMAERDSKLDTSS